jgi:hypothetical protein
MEQNELNEFLLQESDYASRKGRRLIQIFDLEKKICTPQHSINGYVPKATDLHLDKSVCDCKRLMWVNVNTCGCPAETATYELQPTPNIN